MSEDVYLIFPMASHSNRNEFPQNHSNQFKIRFLHAHHLEGSGWKVGLSAISLPDVDVNLTRFKDMGKSLLIVCWLLIPSISSQGVVRTESVSTKLAFLDILYNHNIENCPIFMRTLVFKLDQVTNFKRPAGYLTETNAQKITKFYFR